MTSHATDASARAATPAMPVAPRRLAWLIAAACLVPAVLDALQTYLQARLVEHHAPNWANVIWSASEWLILGVLAPLTIVLSRRFPLRRPHLARSLAAHAAGALTLCIGWALGGATLRRVLGTGWDVPFKQELASWTLTSVPWSVFMYFTVLGCVHAIGYFVEAREREAQASRLAAQLAEARLGALRMQLNPHFLFNSLNAIAVLVRDQDTRTAGRMLELLSDVLRQVLRGDRTHETTLADEVRFLERYLAIEQVRFSDRLRVAFDVSHDVRDAAVPAFVLQPLVENALRHGIAKVSDAGRLSVRAHRDGDALVLSVEDDGPGPPVEGTTERIGLANTRERLATLYGASAQVTLARRTSGGAIATVRLPFHHLTDTTADSSHA